MSFYEKGELLIGRKLRAWHYGSTYHIYNRAVHRLLLFHDEYDYGYFLSVIHMAKRRYNFHLLEYCLMPNHFHLMIQAAETSISVIIQFICSTYARRFNLRHNCSGHLFEKRFSCRAVEGIDYFFALSKYIHMNPVKAKIVDYPDEYEYSSYNAYAFGEINDLLTIEPIMNLFPNDGGKTFRDFTLKDHSARDIEAIIKMDINEVDDVVVAVNKAEARQQAGHGIYATIEI